MNINTIKLRKDMNKKIENILKAGVIGDALGYNVEFSNFFKLK